MGTHQRDVLGWLMPAAPAGEARRARKLVTLLRLLRDDARGRGAESVGVNLASARRALELREQRQARSAQGDMLRHCLHAALPRDSFVCFGTPQLSFQAAWKRSQGLLYPEPGESALELAARCLRASLAQRPGELWRAVWSTRLCQVRLGFAGAKPAWRQLLRRASAEQQPALGEAALLALVQGYLDQGDPRSALRLLGESLSWLPESADLARHRRWIGVLLAEEQPRPGHALIEQEAPLRLPVPLAELRQRLPEAAAWLSGQPRQVGQDPEFPAWPTRQSLGASVLGVRRIAASGRQPESLHWELGRGLRTGLAAFEAQRRLAWRAPGEPEQQLLTQGKPILRYAEPGEVPVGALGPASRSLALVPLPGDSDLGSGWIHLEYDHRLLPSLRRLEQLAACWVRNASRAAGVPQPCALGSMNSRAARASGRRPSEVERLALRLEEQLPAGLGALDAHFVDHPPAGEARVLNAHRAGPLQGVGIPGPVLAEVLRTRQVQLQPVGRGPGARCVAWIPMVSGGRVPAILALEGSPRRLGRLKTRGTLEEFARAWGPAWGAAQASDWHQRHYGCPLLLGLDAELESFGLGSAPGRPGPAFCIIGELGTGKRVLARYLHFEAGGVAANLVQREASGGTWTRHKLRAAWEAAQGGSLVLGDPERLPAKLQRELAAWIRTGRGAQRKAAVRCFCLQRPQLQGPRQAPLDPGLLACFESARLELPSLRARRPRILQLADFLLESRAELYGLDPVQLKDDARAVLWRQRWAGNVRELGALMKRLSHACAGAELGAQSLLALGENWRFALQRRLHGQELLSSDLSGVLRQTACGNGRPNKRRAALYLGWDPQTLARRLRQLGESREVDPKKVGGASCVPS